MDVACFTRLGGVFASVMTGNIVLAGLSIARGSVSLLLHALTTFCGYVAGSRSRPGSCCVLVTGRLDLTPAGPWRRCCSSLCCSAGLRSMGSIGGAAGRLGGVLPAGGRGSGDGGAECGGPADGPHLGVDHVPDRDATGWSGRWYALDRSREGLLRPGVLLGLLAGALLCGLLVARLDLAVPVLFVGAIVTVLALDRL